MCFKTFEMLQVMSLEKGIMREYFEAGNDNGRIVTIQSLSNAQLIQILQHHDDDALTQMSEEEFARCKTDGGPIQ
jgi:hypothetical protein